MDKRGYDLLSEILCSVVPPAPFPVNGKQRRDSSKFKSMFWVMDSEMVIDDRPHEPVLMTAGTWKDRKDSVEFMTGMSSHYHGMDDYALRMRSSVLHWFWRDHISGKSSTCRTKGHILLRDDSNRQGGGME